MPCKTGTREAIEAGKLLIREERERELTDPLRKLWRDLVQRVHDTTDGFAGLSETEKQYFAVGLLDSEIYNGGFDQFFFNHSGTYYSYALLGLKGMGADQVLTLLLQTKHVLFAFDDVPEDTERRHAALRNKISESHTLRLSSSMNYIGMTRTGCGLGAKRSLRDTNSYEQEPGNTEPRAQDSQFVALGDYRDFAARVFSRYARLAKGGRLRRD